MTPATKLRISFLLFSITAAAGCGSGDPFATDPGDSVLVKNATGFAVASSGGGFVAPRPQGAACDPGVWTYTVRIETSQVLWDRCDVVGDGTDPASYMPFSGSRVLPANELDAALTAARMVHVSGQNICGADKPTVHMTVTSSAGDMVYGDDFYSCTKLDDAYVVSQELDNLAAHLRSLVQL